MSKRAAVCTQCGARIDTLLLDQCSMTGDTMAVQRGSFALPLCFIAALHRGSLLLQMLHVPWSVCLCFTYCENVCGSAMWVWALGMMY